MTTTLKFSEPEGPARKIITPLGAACVEAMPERLLVRYIKRRFQDHGECPVSELYSAEEVKAFYCGQSMVITPVARRSEVPTKQTQAAKCPCLILRSKACVDCWHYGGKTTCAACENTGTVIREGK